MTRALLMAIAALLPAGCKQPPCPPGMASGPVCEWHGWPARLRCVDGCAPIGVPLGTPGCFDDAGRFVPRPVDR